MGGGAEAIQTSKRRTDATKGSEALNSQALAPLGATSCKHQATGARGHASAKTVSTGAVNLAGLVCALHDRSRYSKVTLKQAHALDGRAARVRRGPSTVKLYGNGKCPHEPPIGAVDNLAGEGIDSRPSCADLRRIIFLPIHHTEVSFGELGTKQCRVRYGNAVYGNWRMSCRSNNSIHGFVPSKPLRTDKYCACLRPIASSSIG